MRNGVSSYVLASLALAAAVLLRWALEPIMAGTLPLVTLFGAVAVAVWLGGYPVAGIIATLGYLLCAYLFIEPHDPFGLGTPQNLVGLLAYIVTCAIIIGFGEALRVARRRAEVQRETLRVTLASMGDAVITTDPEGRITSLNKAAETLTGWDAQAAGGQPLDSVFRIVNEQTRQKVENPAQRALREGVIVGLANHSVLIRQDNTQRPIDDSAAPIRNRDGKLVGCVLIFRDISERRRLERQAAQQLVAARFLASIVESSADAIISKSLDGTIQSWNAAAERLFGHSANDAIGRHISLVIPPERLNEEDQIIARLRAGERVDHFETVRMRRDGERIHVSLTISPIRDDNGQVVAASKIARDITQRRQLEDDLRKLAAELSEANRRKDEFLAMLAHELRNPLAPVLNGLHVLRLTGAHDGQVGEACEMMERQVNQMVRLIDDLLDVSRITRGKIELKRSRIDLDSVVKHAVEAVRPLSADMGHTLDVTLPAHPIYLDGDPARLAQVVGNLLTNACKFTQHGGNVRVTLERDGNHGIIRVQDTGVGIAPDQAPQIFEMFTQLDSSLERSQGGLGIGLNLAKTLVEMHDGTIEVHSPGIGLGSEFIVRLPVLREPHKSLQPTAAGHRLPAADSHRILVVDDNRDSAESLAMLLRLIGHDVYTAHDGLEALDAATNLKPDVLLLDIGLPKLNGYEVARKIRDQPWGRDVVLVALTGWGQNDDRQKSQQAGFNGHLVKPVEHAALTKLLADLIDSRGGD